MNAIDIALAAHRGSTKPCTLLVDDGLADAFRGESGAACLSQLGLAPEEAWACRSIGRMHLVVLSAPRTAKETFRVLTLTERLVAQGGRILILPTADSASEEVRPEATEIFCGARPEWSRRQIEGDVVELRRRHADVLATEAEAPPTDRIRGKRIVSLSVFGDCRLGTDFWKRMPEFAANYVLAHHAIFLGWELRIHHDEHLYHSNGGDVLFGLARRGLVRLVLAPTRPKCQAMLHRLLPAWDPEVEYVVCRDVDSLPTWRDRCCVEEFIASNLDAGVIHDNREHGGMMGGLSHFHADSLRDRFVSFDAFIAAAGRTDEQWDRHGCDQLWLNEIGFGRILEHSLRSRGVQTIVGSDFRTEIAAPPQSVVDSVSTAVHEGSDVLTNYMGSSGYGTARARAFYDKHSPIARAVREAEDFARSTP